MKFERFTEALYRGMKLRLTMFKPLGNGDLPVNSPSYNAVATTISFSLYF